MMGYQQTAQGGARRQDWCTPPALFTALDAEFRFVLDAAASAENALCPRYWTEADDGLVQDWAAAGGPVYCNPPFRAAGQWIEKAAHEQGRGVTVVMLLPVRPDTRAWQAHILGQPGVTVRWLAGRLTFVGAPSPAPFACAVVVFRPVWSLATAHVADDLVGVEAR